MAIWNKLKQELDRAGQAAQGALDEGRIRLEAFRSRQLADKAAQALGYAVYRARQQGQELDADTYARLSSALASREAETAKYEEQLSGMRARGAKEPPASPAPPEPPASAEAARPAGESPRTADATPPP
ncbi:MAG TPA: hypothetical protein VJ596_12470 [Gemmatimonadaceae bacterium]|nr:hypothetical protein [Gemmatimonadaceae bacterium]